MARKWTERDIELVRGSTAKPWTALGDNLYLRTHVGRDGRVHKSFYWRGGRGSKFRSLGSWPELSLRGARDEVAKVRIGTRNVASVATFAFAAEDFLANLPVDRRPATTRSLESTYRTHLRETLGPRKLRDLTASDISDVLAKPSRQGQRETAIKIASLARRILDRAVVHGHIGHNVASSFKAEHLGGRNPARARVLSDEEISRFLQESHKHPRGHVARFLLATGCRVRETVAARKEWLVEGVLRLPSSITKQKREHRVGLSCFAIEQLQASNDAYLFPSPFHKGRDPLSREAAWLATTTIFRAAKIEGATAHDLRRTARTKWADMKVDPLTAEHMMGHSMPGLLATYDHSRRDTDAARAWEMWGQWLAQLDKA